MKSKGRILVVDDTPASLKLLTEILTAEGYDVRSAINGELALQAAASNPPELVLLDVRMPVMDGYEVCRRLKALPQTAEVPVIFVSGLSDSSDKLEGFALGAVDFVTKPYERGELLSRVRTHVEIMRLRNHLEEQVAERTKELTESERKTSLILDSSPVPFASCDQLGRIAYINQAFVRDIGYTLDEIPDLESWWPLAYPNVVYREQIRSAWFQYLDQIRHGSRPDPLEGRVRCKDGSVKIVQASASLVETIGEELVLVAFHDITAQKRAEAVLLEHKLVLETCHDGYWMTDKNGILLDVNQAYAGLSGYRVDELIGKHIADLEAIENADDVNARIQAIMVNGWDRFESRHRHKHGHEYDVEVSVTYAPEIGKFVVFFRDISDRKKAEEQIARLAFYDSLTGLPNRRLSLDRLDQALAASARSQRNGALMLIDLDDFKTLNDTLGHDMGDLLLKQVAERLLSCVRAGDTVARLGGDEFVVILEDLNEKRIDAAERTKLVAGKLIEVINMPFQLGENVCRSTPSIGATLFSKGLSGDEHLKQADIALYHAKSAGRNMLCFFDTEMQTAVQARAQLESELRDAIHRGEFQLYYQMQVDAALQIIGAEALIRWPHPVRGFVSPGEFIPLAEQSGLIVPIGSWVLDTACAQLRSWQDNPATCELTLSINVSARQFHEEGFVELVRSKVQQYGIQAGKLRLEPTESILLENVEQAVGKLNALKEMGVRFSLDDFGTGYSSLQYLKRLPLDELKIDQSFVRDLGDNANDLAIVRTIIAMARSLNLMVIAEGVETVRQLQYLQDLGCGHYQGYLFGKPVPIHDFELALLRDAETVSRSLMTS